MPRYSILFFGTPDFAIPILERLHQEHNIKAVITQPDKPVGRKKVLSPPPVKTRALALGLQVLQPKQAGEILSLISERIDFIVTAAYGQYLPKKILELPQLDALNVHVSLLPSYRGATPMQEALLNGDTKTGVSIIRMVKKMDAGPIFSQQQFPLPPDMKYPELEEKSSQVGAKLIANVINNYASISPQEQDQGQASNCSKISKQDGQINWPQEDASQIYNKLRAYTPWPGIYTFWKDQKLSLIDFLPHPQQESDQPPGSVYQDQEKTLIQCSKGAIEILALQLAGKKETDVRSFLNGYPEFLSTKL